VYLNVFQNVTWALENELIEDISGIENKLILWVNLMINICHIQVVWGNPEYIQGGKTNEITLFKPALKRFLILHTFYSVEEYFEYSYK
jgi:hypothetical protein